MLRQRIDTIGTKPQTPYTSKTSTGTTDRDDVHDCYSILKNSIDNVIRCRSFKMILQIVSISHRRTNQQPPLKKSRKLILSHRMLLMITLGLLLMNAVMVALQSTITESTYATYIKIDRPQQDRWFPRVICVDTAICLNSTNQFAAWIPANSRRVVDMGNAKARRNIARRDDIDLDIVEDENCTLRSEWQRTSFPTCNSIHEWDGTQPWSIIRNHPQRFKKLYRIIGNGFWRDVWLLQYEHGIPDEKAILKTMRYHHPYTLRNMDRMRRDSVTMERLTKSPFIVNLYGFCGTTSVSEYGDGGDIPDALWPSTSTSIPQTTTSITLNSSLSQLEKLRIATQAAIALATVHNIDQEGYPTIAHTDIAPAQFIKVNDVYKLNDFNRARFIAYRYDELSQTDVMCPYQIGSNPGKNRSPEEYNYEPQTEKVDVYSLGNIFYMLLQGDWPFYDVPQETAMELVKNGTRPSVYMDVWFSTDPIDVALKEAMMMCHEQNATERATARMIEHYLLSIMRQIDYHQLEAWNLT